MALDAAGEGERQDVGDDFTPVAGIGGDGGGDAAGDDAALEGGVDLAELQADRAGTEMGEQCGHARRVGTDLEAAKIGDAADRRIAEEVLRTEGPEGDGAGAEAVQQAAIEG